MDAKKKLSEYRAKRQRQAYINTANETLKSIFRFRTRLGTQMSSNGTTDVSENVLLINTEEELEEISSNAESDNLNCTYSYITIITYFLYFILWLTLLAIFVKLQFGLVFLIMSALIAMYLNTRTGPKHQNEVSAYSVFNKNCESIDGTLKAEQFEREIRYGSGAVH